MLRVTINNEEYKFEAGLTVLQALRTAGVEVPTLCHDERFKPARDCRMCLVQIAGMSHPVTACNTQLADGMAIETHTPALEEERRGLLGMLTDRYPPATVHLFPQKPLHRYLRDYGLDHKCYGVSDPAMLDDSHPYINVDMSRCIVCRISFASTGGRPRSIVQNRTHRRGARPPTWIARRSSYPTSWTHSLPYAGPPRAGRSPRRPSRAPRRPIRAILMIKLRDVLIPSA